MTSVSIITFNVGLIMHFAVSKKNGALANSIFYHVFCLTVNNSAVTGIQTIAKLSGFSPGIQTIAKVMDRNIFAKSEGTFPSLVCY